MFLKSFILHTVPDVINWINCFWTYFKSIPLLRIDSSQASIETFQTIYWSFNLFVKGAVFQHSEFYLSLNGSLNHLTSHNYACSESEVQFGVPTERFEFRFTACLVITLQKTRIFVNDSSSYRNEQKTKSIGMSYSRIYQRKKDFFTQVMRNQIFVIFQIYKML